MLSIFKKYLTDKIILSDEEWAIIVNVCSIRKLRKHQFLLQEGDLWRYHAFICRGCLRRYRMDEKGTEHIIQFAMENWWTGDRESLMNGTPSKYYIDAIEDSVVALIWKEDFARICKEIPVFNEFINDILFKSLNASQERIHATISLKAEEQYLNFIETFPHLVNRIPGHMLASYLGISPETLSRIKSQVTKR